MSKHKSISEASPGYKTAEADIQNPVILHHEGQPLAVVISYDEYQRLRILIADEEQRRQAGWAALEVLLKYVHQRPSDYTAEQIEAEIGIARVEVKKLHRAHPCSY